MKIIALATWNFHGFTSGSVVSFVARGKYFQKRGVDFQLHTFFDGTKEKISELKADGFSIDKVHKTLCRTTYEGVPIYLHIHEKVTPFRNLEYFDELVRFREIRNERVHRLKTHVSEILQEEKPSIVYTLFDHFIVSNEALQQEIPVHSHCNVYRMPGEKIHQKWIRNHYRQLFIVSADSQFLSQRLQRAFGRKFHIQYPMSPFEREDLSLSIPTTKEILQVNCSLVKGGLILYLVAKLLPDYQFTTMGGYGGSLEEEQNPFFVSPLKNVSLLPRNIHMGDVYQRSRIVLCPSLCHEAFGLTAFEASLQGRPVIANRDGGLPEALGGGGFIISGRSPHPDEIAKVAKIDFLLPRVKKYVSVIRRLLESDTFYRVSAKRAKRCGASVKRKMLRQADQYLERYLKRTEMKL